jgi:hypothetical protein
MCKKNSLLPAVKVVLHSLWSPPQTVAGDPLYIYIYYIHILDMSLISESIYDDTDPR